MSKETKFGYGFLLAGIGLPYIIDKLLGPLSALIIAAICTLGGIALLVAGHSHREHEPIGFRVDRRRYWPSILTVILMVAMGFSLTIAIRRFAGRPEASKADGFPSTKPEPFSMRIGISIGPQTIDRHSYTALCVRNRNDITLFSNALFVYITNNLPHRVRISAFHITTLTTQGEWKRLLWEDRTPEAVYYIRERSSDFRKVIVRPVKVSFLQPRMEADIESGETISGWIFVAADKGDIFPSPVKTYRIDLRDIQGDSYQSGDLILTPPFTNGDDDDLHTEIVFPPSAWKDIGKSVRVFYMGEVSKLN